jgi:succinyl-CoA synthetase beta subunit
MAGEQIKKLYDMFIKSDCTQVEINPMIETTDARVMCLDAKLNFDDNAQFRQKDIFAQRDTTQEDPREVEASKYDLNFIGLDGNIGCMVNGAGLAMSTMDIIQMHGGKPANFLDCGGGANLQAVMAAFKILNDDPNVDAILVNIFGGIVDCKIIAQGIAQAAKEINIKCPLVVRLQGTNHEEASKFLKESGVRVMVENDLDSAANKCVKIAEMMSMAHTADLNVSFELTS